LHLRIEWQFIFLLFWHSRYFCRLCRRRRRRQTFDNLPEEIFPSDED